MFGNWATDTFVETANVYVSNDPAYAFCAVGTINAGSGTFTTIGPKSPQAGVNLSAGITGTINGGETWLFPSGTATTTDASTLTAAPVNTTGDSQFSNWQNEVFGATTGANSFTFTYVTDADSNITWLNDGAGNTGDITNPTLSTVYVDGTNGNDSTNIGSSVAPFKTIQAAVNAVADGGTVNVAAGNYGSETLSSDKVVTINGVESGVDARSGRPAVTGESVVKLTVTAGDVTLDGFTFDAAGAGTAIKGLYLAPLGTHNGLVVKNSVIENGFFGLELPSNTLLPSFTADKNYFLNNGIASNANQLWAISPDTTTKIVTNNKFTGNDNADININWGSATVTGNESVNDATLLVATETSDLNVSNNSGTFNGDGTAIYIGKGNHNVTVSGNSVSGAIRGVKIASDFGGVNGGATTAAIITGNTITNSTTAGIFVQNGAYNGAITIDHNIIQGSSVPAINFEAGSGVTASGSQIANNNLGDAAIGISWLDSGILDGTNNFWNTGTTNPSFKTATSSSGDITVSPWYTDAAMTTLQFTTTTSGATTTATTGSTSTNSTTTATVAMKSRLKYRRTRPSKVIPTGMAFFIRLK